MIPAGPLAITALIVRIIGGAALIGGALLGVAAVAVTSNVARLATAGLAILLMLGGLGYMYQQSRQLVAREPDEVEREYQAAAHGAQRKMLLGSGLLVLGFGFAGLAAMSQAWVTMASMLVITALGLILIITASNGQIEAKNQRRHRRGEVSHERRHHDIKAALDRVARLTDRVDGHEARITTVETKVKEIDELHDRVHQLEEKLAVLLSPNVADLDTLRDLHKLDQKVNGTWPAS